jgi:hypothetical protein
VLTSPGHGRERAPAYGSPARFGIVPNSPARPARGVLAGGDELRHQHSHHHSHSHSHARRDAPGLNLGLNLRRPFSDDDGAGAR